MPPAGGIARTVLYGRRRGPRLRPHRRRLVETLLPDLAFDLPAAGTLDPRALFGTRAPVAVWLEIGFGAGEHLAARAAQRPDIGFIGCEPYIYGVAALLAEIERRDLGNVRILVDDARGLLGCLAPASISGVDILFPDPWPKTRHHKRRLIQAPVLEALAQACRDGAPLHFATDHAEYARWALAHLRAHAAFEWEARRAADWRTRPWGAPPTRYEEKARAAGRAAIHLSFRRRARHKTLEGLSGAPV